MKKVDVKLLLCWIGAVIVCRAGVALIFSAVGVLAM